MEWNSEWGIHPLSHLSPDTIKKKIAEMVESYQREPRKDVARSIGLHYRLLCMHTGHRPSCQQRCAWFHMALYWRYLEMQQADLPDTRSQPEYAVEGDCIDALS